MAQIHLTHSLTQNLHHDLIHPQTQKSAHHTIHSFGKLFCLNVVEGTIAFLHKGTLKPIELQQFILEYHGAALPFKSLLYCVGAGTEGNKCRRATSDIKSNLPGTIQVLSQNTYLGQILNCDSLIEINGGFAIYTSEDLSLTFHC